MLFRKTKRYIVFVPQHLPTKSLKQNKRRKCYKYDKNGHFANDCKDDINNRTKMNVTGKTSMNNIQMTLKAKTIIKKPASNAKKACEPTKMWVLKKD